MNKQKGNLIVIYGINSLGKTTQAKLLVESIIIKLGKSAEYLKYAVYNLEPSGPLIMDYLKGGNRYEFTTREFQFLQVLNRTQYQPELLKKIDNGTLIVAEDYVGSGIAWGLANGIDKKLLYDMNSHLLKENLGLLFVGEPFAEDLDKKNFHEKDIAVLKTVNQYFQDIAKDFNWHIINANRPVEVIQEEIFQIVKSKTIYLD
jgi:dTMP kinase